MELDCTMFEGIEFDGIVDADFPIRCCVKHPGGGYNVYNFTEYGCWNNVNFAKCVIFPKGKTTWEGFVPPCKFKNGDILYAIDEGNEFIFILKHIYESVGRVYCYLSLKGDDLRIQEVWLTDYNPTHRLATEEEKQKLFDAIKANGYKWNEETKTLEKLVEPKFKAGDRIRSKNKKDECFYILNVDKDRYKYILNIKGYCLEFRDQNNYELVPNKFDITTLKPFDKVLVRDNDEQMWTADIFSFYNEKHVYPFMCVGHYPNQCIPYEQNKHLLGTTNDCNEFYKTWE